MAKIILNQGCRPEEIMSARKCDVKTATLNIPGGKSRAARRELHPTPESSKSYKRD